MSINQNQLEKLLITLLFISIAFLFMSCGSRKVSKTAVKEEIKTEITATEKKDVETNKEIKTVVNDETDEIEVIPIDTAKVIIINGKTYKNAKVKIVKRKVNTTIAEKATVKDNSVKKADIITTEKAQTKTNDTQRKSNPLLNLLWLLIPAAAYFLYKKNLFII